MFGFTPIAAAPIGSNTSVAGSFPAGRYWVGGSGTWDATTTTNWSATSGGAGGASVPTSTDDVFFDQASTYTVTIASGTRVCKDFTLVTGAVTFSGNPNLTISGSLLWMLPPTSFTSGISLIFNGAGSQTMATSGFSTGSAISFTGSTLTMSLAGALTNTNTSGISVTGSGAVLNTAGYTVTASKLAGTAGTINLGASTVTLSNQNPLTYSGTLNAGTSQLNLSSSSTTLTLGGSNTTLYNVTFTSTSPAVSITGAYTFNTLYITGAGGTGLFTVAFGANQTIGTLTLASSGLAYARVMLMSSVFNTQRTLAVTTLTAGAGDVDFQDIAVTGTTLTGTRFGDAGGNSGITFPAAKTVYFRATGSANWGSATSWSATSGGAAASSSFPLAQDTAVFPAATYPASGATTTVNAAYNIGTIDMSLRTANTMTLVTGSNSPYFYGGWINGTGITLTGSGVLTFAGRTTQNITSAGKSFAASVTVNTPGGTVVLQDAFVLAAGGGADFVHNNGTINLNGQTLTIAGATNATYTTGVGTKNLAFNGGSLVINSTSGFNNAAPTGFTTTAGTGTGTISLTSASTKTFVGGGSTFNCTLNQGGAGQLSVSGSNTFLDITNTYSATGATSVKFTAGATNIFTAFNLTGTVGKVCTLGSLTAAQTTLQKGTVWQMGANSTDGGNNSGLSFVAGGGIDYLSVSYINGTVVGGGTVYNVNLSDTATATDAISAIFNAYSALTETTTGTDAITVTYTANPAVSETGTATDADTAQYVANPNITETATATDTVDPQSTANAAVSETATATDFLAVSAAWAAIVAETGTATDLVFGFSGNLYLVSIDESASIADVAAAAISFRVTVAETATATDSLTTLATFRSTVVGTATATDSPRAAQVFRGTLAEAATASDAISRVVAFYVQVAEGTTATDATAIAASIFNAPFEDTIGVIDTVVASSTYNASVLVALVASDTIVGAFLWNLIDDAQTANWQNIGTNQTPNWVVIDTAQVPGWTGIDT